MAAIPNPTPPPPPPTHMQSQLVLCSPAPPPPPMPRIPHTAPVPAPWPRTLRVWQDDAKREHVVWYPTPHSLEVRLELFGGSSVGASIWELGQGMERFMDLL